MDANEMFYNGGSMRGMFRPGDRLVFEPVTLPDLQPGDVVVYRKPAPDQNGHASQIVHRVIAITPGGAIMRGDNNVPGDVELVLPQYIVGRVTHFFRNDKERRMRDGLFGLVAARFTYHANRLPRQIGRRIHILLRPVLQAPYRLLRKSRLVMLFWQPTITQITIKTPTGPLVKYVHRGRTVVRWWPERNVYHAIRPYDLIVFPPDAATLPPEIIRDS